MQTVRPILICLLLLTALPAQAGLVEAKDIARASNCRPVKSEIVSETIGTNPETIYRFTCAPAPGISGTPEVLILCRNSFCQLLR
jgi:hypothetical protein